MHIGVEVGGSTICIEALAYINVDKILLLLKLHPIAVPQSPSLYYIIVNQFYGNER